MTKKKTDWSNVINSSLKQQEGVGNDTRCWTSCNNKVYASFRYEYNIYELTPDTCRINCEALIMGKNIMFFSQRMAHLFLPANQ